MGTPYSPNVNPYGDFVPDFAKAKLRTHNQITVTRYCWQHLAASVKQKSSTFVSNFLCRLQVVFDTGDTLHVMLPGCQSLKTTERANTRYS
jgi:hypothetical protein